MGRAVQHTYNQIGTGTPRVSSHSTQHQKRGGEKERQHTYFATICKHMAAACQCQSNSTQPFTVEKH